MNRTLDYKGYRIDFYFDTYVVYDKNGRQIARFYTTIDSLTDVKQYIDVHIARCK